MVEPPVSCPIRLKENGLLDDILAENEKVYFCSNHDGASDALTCTLHHIYYIGLHVYCCRVPNKACKEEIVS
jgi:hypothetical protein